MKKIIMLLTAVCLCFLTACQGDNQDKRKNTVLETMQNEPEAASQKKTLIVYFSRYGNTEYPDDIDASTSASIVIKDEQRYGTTEYAANLIQKKIGGDLQLIQTKNSYTDDFNELRDINHKEMSDHKLPELVNQINSSQYDTVFIGYPVWASSIPQAVQSLLDEYDFSDKTIIPFCTHDGYGAGNSFNDIKAAEPGAEVLDGLAIDSSDISDAESSVTQWLDTLGLLDETKDETAIKIEVNGQILEGVLYDNELADEIRKHLPFTVTMSGYGGREYYGGIDFTPTHTAKGQLNFENGDITYCAQNNTMAIFYAQTDHPNLTMEVIPIGKMKSDLTVFGELPSSADLTFSLT